MWMNTGPCGALSHFVAGVLPLAVGRYRHNRGYRPDRCHRRNGGHRADRPHRCCGRYRHNGSHRPDGPHRCNGCNRRNGCNRADGPHRAHRGNGKHRPYRHDRRNGRYRPRRNQTGGCLRLLLRVPVPVYPGHTADPVPRCDRPHRPNRADKCHHHRPAARVLPCQPEGIRRVQCPQLFAGDAVL